MGLFNPYQHHTLYLEFFSCQCIQGLNIFWEHLIIRKNILGMTLQFPTFLDKDINHADAYLGVALNISNTDRRGNMGNNQVLLIEYCKYFFR